MKSKEQKTTGYQIFNYVTLFNVNAVKYRVRVKEGG
jgi:hypothetical protein